MSIYRVPVINEFPWQPPVLDKDLSTPPVSPTKGDRYIVGPSAIGAWVTHEDEIAYYDGAAWAFDTPQPGWKLYVVDEDVYYLYSSSVWAVDVQAYDAGLTNLANVTMAADKFYYTSADDVHVAGTVTAAGRALIDDATVADQATTLGLGTEDTPTFAGIKGKDRAKQFFFSGF